VVATRVRTHDEVVGDVPRAAAQRDPAAARLPPNRLVRSQFAYWKHTHLTIDVVTGRGAGFSLEAPEGVRFLVRSRVFTDEEHARLG
jgi:uncharacterized protein